MINLAAFGERVSDPIESIYVRPEERFVVALVVGYAADDAEYATLLDEFGHEDDPMLAAAAAALQLTRDYGSDDTQWFVLDRLTGEHRMVEQGDFDSDHTRIVNETQRHLTA
jgi:hypothetical protein